MTREATEVIFTSAFGYPRPEWESTSGSGSDLIQTAVIREEIPKLIATFNIMSMIDAPCGDFYWMKTVPLGVQKYTGIDIIKHLIQANQERHGNETRSFITLDLMEEVVPQADLILCRDCLVHHTIKDIFTILNQFKKSGAKYLLTTSFPGRSTNRNISTGDWFPLNLNAPPFNFPPPLQIINENCTELEGSYIDKSLCLWNLEEVALPPP